MPKQNESLVRSEKFSNVVELFRLCFCTPKTKITSTSQAQIKPEIFVNFRPKLEPKSPARRTILTCRDARESNLQSLELRFSPCMKSFNTFVHLYITVHQSPLIFKSHVVPSIEVLHLS